MLQHSGMHYFCHTSNSMRYINPLNRARLFSLVSAASSTPPLQDLPPPLPLLLLLDVPFPDFEAVPVSPCLCPPRGLQTFTKRVTLPLKTCWQMHHWLACSSLSSLVGEVGDTTRGCSIPLQRLKWLHHLSGLWSPIPCCKQIYNCYGISVAWPHFPMRAEEITLAWQTDNCCGICGTL